jgi:hypothetical protein
MVTELCAICHSRASSMRVGYLPLCMWCDRTAFNSHWHNVVQRTKHRLGVKGNDYLPQEMRRPFRDAEYALLFLKRAIKQESEDAQGAPDSQPD